MKNKKLIALTTLALAMMTVLTGCGKPITLETAQKNNTDITAFSYDVNLHMSASNMGDAEDMTLQMDMDGQSTSTEDRVKTRADVSATINGQSLNFPIYIDTATKEFDFDIYAGIPDLIKDTFVGKTDFYTSSEQLKMLLQLVLPEDQYTEVEKTLQKSFEPDDQATALSTALAAHIQAYFDINKDKIQKFESIKGKKTSENGTYSYTLSKTDIQTMATEFLRVEGNYQLLKDKYATVAKYDQATFQEMPDAETMIKAISDAADKLKSFDLTIKFTIEAGYITGIDFDTLVKDENDVQVGIVFDILLSDINKDVTVNMPDKTADSTLDIIDYIKGNF